MTSRADRLAEIERWYEDRLKQDGDNVFLSDVRWLIAQVRELEGVINRAYQEDFENKTLANWLDQ